MASAPRREGHRSKKVRVLIAVEPHSLLRIMELILSEASEIQILARPGDAAALQRHAKRLQPDLLITNARLLGDDARAVLSHIKRLSPQSKIILTYFDANIADLATQGGVDFYLKEEFLVRKLLKDVRRLTLERSTVGRPQKTARAKRTG